MKSRSLISGGLLKYPISFVSIIVFMKTFYIYKWNIAVVIILYFSNCKIHSIVYFYPCIGKIILISFINLIIFICICKFSLKNVFWYHIYHNFLLFHLKLFCFVCYNFAYWYIYFLWLLNNCDSLKQHTFILSCSSRIWKCKIKVFAGLSYLQRLLGIFSPLLYSGYGGSRHSSAGMHPFRIFPCIHTVSLTSVCQTFPVDILYKYLPLGEEPKAISEMNSVSLIQSHLQRLFFQIG